MGENEGGKGFEMTPASCHRQWRWRPLKMGSGCSGGDVGVGGRKKIEKNGRNNRVEK